MTTEARLDQLFSLLTVWRGFPNYQLERRVDIFFALYLRDILRDRFPHNQFDLIIPEFPLHYGTIRENQGNRANLSAKVDYACVDRACGFCVLVELKTEERSISNEQFANMTDAAKAGYDALHKGVGQLLQYTREKAKYTTLLRYLESELHKEAKTKVSGTPQQGVNLVIIKPTANAEGCPDGSTVICFDDVATVLRKIPEPADHLTLTFLNALENWKEPLTR